MPSYLTVAIGGRLRRVFTREICGIETRLPLTEFLPYPILLALLWCRPHVPRASSRPFQTLLDDPDMYLEVLVYSRE